MIEIPVTVIDGVQHPAEPIPAHALASLCDGSVYRVAETPEEAALICPPPSPGEPGATPDEA